MMKSPLTCEARRRDGSPCPHAWKHCLHATIGYRGDRIRSVYLCGMHRSTLHKGIMVVHLIADPGHIDAFISADRNGNYSYTSKETHTPTT